MDQRALEQLRKCNQMISTQNRKKVLILSLGTGRMKFIKIDGQIVEEKEFTKEEKKQMIMEGRLNPYDETEYEMPDNDGIIKTAFVAEPLMRLFKPEEVIIVGISKSAWTSFFGAFGDINELKNQRMSELFELEANGGKDLDVAQLTGYAEKIQQCYQCGMTKGVFQGVPIHIIVTRYGVNSEELLENYRLLGDSVGAVLCERDIKYEVAFDITHSFRSMPIYNLVILNYLQNVSRIDLEITHIYYGNLEVKSENGGRAPIIDLDELIKVLKLSNSVNEFKNTGNAFSLMQSIADIGELRKALEEFDWATQINANDMAIECFEKLMAAAVQMNDNESSKYVDLRKMIFSVIIKKFFDNEEIAESGLEKAVQVRFQKMSLGEKQYRLSKWYFNQNRYGQALATALESLRSYLVTMYLEWKEKNVSLESVSNENNRKAAVDRLKYLVSMIRKNTIVMEGDKNKLQKVSKVFCSLEDSRAAVKPIRDVFAHNLDRFCYENKSTAAEDKSAKELIFGFFHDLDQFVKWVQMDKEAVKTLYMAESKTQKHKVKRGKSVRLIISSAGAEVQYGQYRKSNNQNVYSVYTIDDEIKKYLDKNTKTKNYKDAAVFLAEYVKRLELDPEMTHIILYKLSPAQQLSYMQALRSNGFQHIYDENRTTDSLPDIGFDIGIDRYTQFYEAWNGKYENDGNVQAFKDKELICVHE